MPLSQQIIRSGGAKLFTLTDGDGPPMVFLHAGVADHRMWAHELAHFAQRYHVLAYDRREFGQTVSPNEPFRHMDDLKTVLDHMGTGPAILVGCSQGGRIAVDFALHHPDRVSALILVAPALSGAPIPDTFPPAAQPALDALDVAEDQDDLDAINAAEAHLWLDGPTSENGRVSGPLRDLFLDMNGVALRHEELPQEQDPPSAMDRLDQIHIPTLVIWGDRDFPHIQARCTMLVEHIPDAKGTCVPGCAHLVNMEQPKHFISLVEEFLAA
ncbi:alpha/beta fold hydrolase [Aliiroseovarius crassostreae]|uniref:alpha/beta fold hydrolase n=1 Tax=Aliiroseovarius crassostreae TaxID=154981 RepID=UPI003C7EAD51